MQAIKHLLFLGTIIGATTFAAQKSNASCAFINSPPTTEYNILQTWPIRHISDSAATGCLGLLSQKDDKESGTMTAYLPYDFTCKMSPKDSIILRIGQSCCDTGRQGDYPCGIIPEAGQQGFSSGISPDTQTNLTAVPHGDKHAKDIIPELIAKLERNSLYGSIAVAKRLADFASSAETRLLVEAYRDRLEKIFRNTEHTNHLAAALVLKKLIDPSEMRDIHAAFLSESLSLYPEDQKDALEYFNAYPEQLDADLTKALIQNFLATAEGESAAPILDLLARAPNSFTRPLLMSVYNALSARSKNGYDVSAAQNAKDIEHWKKLVCSTYPLPHDIEYQKIVFDTPYDPLPTVECSH